MALTAFRVHKFGGSSVADAGCLTRVASILEADATPRLAVVLSASRGVTDALLALVAAAAHGQAGAGDLERLRTRHRDMAVALLSGDSAGEYQAQLDADCRDIHGVLDAVALTRDASPVVRDVVAGFGELWSSRLFATYLRERGGRAGRTVWIDARDIIEVEPGALGPSVRWDASRRQAALQVPADEAITLIVPGFVARDAKGSQTTLGRNGSDYSASIFGALLGAADIHIWTDVDGILSADPSRVPDARLVAALSYEEAMELAYFGAKVLHPQTMAPAVAGRIPIRIRNTFRPEAPGTLICQQPDATDLVKGITSVDHMALLNLEGAGMIGVPGTAQRLFAALREHAISVVLISQASSEHSICFAVPMAQAAEAERVVREAFERELGNGQIQRVDVTLDCSILAVVGDGMEGVPGVAAKVFGALGSAGVNVRAIAQGASERNISAIIESHQATRALRAVHSRFYLSPHTISIGLIGPGLVGSALLEQIASQADRLRQRFNLDLRVRGLLDSRRMVLADRELDLAVWKEALAGGGPADLAAFEAHVHAEHLPHAVIIDCTASAEVARSYPRWLSHGVHVVTPNKRANSGDWGLYAQLVETCSHTGSHYLIEATVGAGLPVIQTLRDLRETGDEIRQIDGILSGTLSYLFNVWDGSRPFSGLLREARRQGYTEPDPRDDLSGMDVGRKLVILGREMGLRLSLEEVAIESLVPPGMGGGTAEEFLARAEVLDGPMAARLDTARQAGRVLRYVGVLDARTRRATVGLTELDRAHPFANINFTDNVVRYLTARYDRNPLVVQGPGAGPAVTAGGVFADLLRVCAYLGARR
ncbi:MAG: bifunctional aspartate kinase/homoserine dehydrogenase I [Acidobacteriota bacterium]